MSPPVGAMTRWRPFLLPAALLAGGMILAVAGALLAFQDGEGQDGFSSALSNSGAFESSSSAASGAVDEILGDEENIPDVEPTATAGADEPIILQDTFDSNVNGWPVGDFADGQAASRHRSLENGVYRLELEAEGGWLAPELLEVDVGSGFRVAVDARREAGSSDSVCGLVLAAAGSYPRLGFLVSDLDRGFRVFRAAAQGDGETVIDLTPATAVRAAGVNRLEVLVEGPRFVLFINGEQVKELEDAGVGGVRNVGVVTGLWSDGGAATCEFDNLDVRAP